MIVVGTYYWVYIRQTPFPSHLHWLPTRPRSRESTAQGEISIRSPQKRRRKTAASTKKSASRTTELLTGIRGTNGDEGESVEAKSKQTQDERTNFSEVKTLKGVFNL